jgi:hypothetical protein
MKITNYFFKFPRSCLKQNDDYKKLMWQIASTCKPTTSAPTSPPVACVTAPQEDIQKIIDNSE